MRRLGVLTPSSNTVLEPMTTRLLAPIDDLLSVHVARFRVTRIANDVGSDTQFALKPMLAAAGLLADAKVDAILWSGTSGAWVGIESDRRLVESITRVTNVPATTATLAMLDAFRALGVTTYGLVVPYVKPIVDLIVEQFDEQGYRCCSTNYESLTDNWEFATVSEETIMARVRAAAEASPDAIVIHCTNLRGAEVAPRLEQEIGIPILDSVAVGLWGALRIVGVEPPAAGFGMLTAQGRGASLG